MKDQRSQPLYSNFSSIHFMQSSHFQQLNSFKIFCFYSLVIPATDYSPFFYFFILSAFISFKQSFSDEIIDVHLSIEFIRSLILYNKKIAIFKRVYKSKVNLSIPINRMKYDKIRLFQLHFQFMIIKNLRNIALLVPRKFNFSEWDWQQMPKPWNLKHTKEEKMLLFNKQTQTFPKPRANFNDTLTITGLDKDKLMLIYEDLVYQKDTRLSSQFISLLLYQLSKFDLLNKSSWVKLEPYITRNRGEYSARSIFGCFYAIIKYGKPEYINFFKEEMLGQTMTFSEIEAVEIIEAFNKSKYNYTLEEKHRFWDQYFKSSYVSVMSEGRIHKMDVVFRIFDAFNKFQYYQDEDIWNQIFSWMERRKGWKRTQIIERLYPLTGTFSKAKELFDVYYNELSSNIHIKWRYNLEELRLFTSEQMIAKSQTNIQLSPSYRTLVKSRKQSVKFNQQHQEWLKDGARLKAQEVVKDNAYELIDAIKNRFNKLKSENVDLSKMPKEQFEELFGEYDEQLMKQIPKNRPIYISKEDRQNQEQQQMQRLQEKKNKKK